MSNSNDNQAGSSKWKGFGKDLGAFWASEMVSAVTLPGAVFLMEQLPPSLIKETSKAIGKCLEPVIEPLEKIIGTICKLEECKIDTSLSRAERAEKMARFLVIFTPPAILTYTLKLGLRRGLGMHGPEGAKWWQPWNMTGREWMLALTDEGTHIALMGAIQGPFAKQGDQAIRDLKSVFHKSGMSERTAHELAAALVIHEGPNIAGGLVGSAGLAATRMIYGAPGK